MHRQKQGGFTIVELLIVIVVIAILAAITIVSYNGITQRTKEATVKSDLQTAQNKIGLYQVDNGSYPTSADDLMTASGSNVLQYLTLDFDNTTYCMTVKNPSANIAFHMTQDGKLVDGECPTAPESCFGFSSGTGTITDYYDTENNDYVHACPRGVFIPKTIGGVAVQHIADEAMTTKSLTGIAMPDSITSVGFNAFRDNHITPLYLSASLNSIGDASFADNWIKTLTIPASLTTIETRSFMENQLTKINWSSANTTIKSDAFYGNNFKTITFPRTITSIASTAFNPNSQLTAVSVPTTTTVSGTAFPIGVTITTY